MRSYPFPAPGGVTSRVVYPSELELVGGRAASYAYLYRSQPWIAVCVNKWMSAIGQLPLKTYMVADGDKSLVRPGTSAPGKLAGLLRTPWPHATPTELKQSIAGSLGVYGNFLGIKIKPNPNGLPTELWPAQWWRVQVVPGKDRPIEFFGVQLDDGKVIPFTPDEVVHTALWSPNGIVGVSPLEPLRRTLAVEDAALRETVASFENAGRPGGAFVAPGRLSADQARDLRAELNATYGGPDNAYKIAVLHGALDWKPLAFNHEEQQLIPVRQLAREECAAVFDLPPTTIGILDHATYSNVSELHRALYQDSLGPKLVLIEESLEAQLLAPEPEWAGLDLEFDLNEVMKASIADRAEAYTKLIRVGFPPNFFLHLENQPESSSAWAQSGYIARELLPLDEELQAATAQAALDKIGAAAAARTSATPMPDVPMDSPAMARMAASMEAAAARSGGETHFELRLPDSVQLDMPAPQVNVDNGSVISALADVNQRLEAQSKAIERQAAKTAEAIAEALRPKVRKVIRDENSNIVEIREVQEEETV